MTAKEALNLVDILLWSTFGHRLNDIQSVIFRESWLGRTYAEIAVQISYEHDYIKQIGFHLWRRRLSGLSLDIAFSGSWSRSL